MSQSQQLPQSSFTYLPHSPNSLPNTLLPFPQPPNLLSQPLLYPPGTEPYAHSGHLTLTHVEFEAHAQFHDPNVGQSWITRQADPIKYDTTVSFSWVQFLLFPAFINVNFGFFVVNVLFFVWILLLGFLINMFGSNLH